MKHSVSFISMIVPQLGHSFVAPLGGLAGGAGAGRGGARGAGGAALGGAAREGATGGGGGTGSSFFRRFATGKNSNAPITTAGLVPRDPPNPTGASPAPLIANVLLWAGRVAPP